MNKLREQIYVAFSASNKSRSVYAAWANKMNISYHGLFVLYILSESKGITQKQICGDNGIPKQTINNIITSFLKKGYIKTIPGNNDKREKSIVLTKKGIEYAKRIVSPLIAMEEEAAKRMGAARMALMAEVISEFGQILENLMMDSKHENGERKSK